MEEESSSSDSEEEVKGARPKGRAAHAKKQPALKKVAAKTIAVPKNIINNKRQAVIPKKIVNWLKKISGGSELWFRYVVMYLNSSQQVLIDLMFSL